MLSNTVRLNCYLKIIHIFHQRYHPKVIEHYLKNKQKSECVCIHQIVRVTIMKMRMKNRSHRYDINRPEPRYTKYKKCLNMLLLIRINQYLSNIWSSIHKQVKQHWGWVEKKHCLWKKRVCNIALFKFMAYSLYVLKKAAENHKSYGQAPNQSSESCGHNVLLWRWHITEETSRFKKSRKKWNWQKRIL